MENFFTELSKTNIFSGIRPDELEELLKNKPFRLKNTCRMSMLPIAGHLS